MYLTHLSIINFKNYSELELKLNKKVNCFVGNNGVGKTNILDAIYYLSNCKSYFNTIDKQNINHGKDFFLIKGEFLINEVQEVISCAVQKGKKKKIKKGKKEYEKFSNHIGFIPSVIITPYDINLIYEGSEERRKFIDSIIAQYNKEYLTQLINYQKVLSQRNALLKRFAETNTFDNDSLEVWDIQLIDVGQKIFDVRKQFIKEFNEFFNELYKQISDNKEDVSLSYNSKLLEESFEKLLTQHINKDKAIQYTSVGIHKDDYVFSIGGFPIKKFGSQGQQKTFLIALKLAQYKYLEQKMDKKPILMLDDIYDKLDSKRSLALMNMIKNNDFGQVFITDTNQERISNYFNENNKISVFNIENGELISK